MHLIVVFQSRVKKECIGVRCVIVCFLLLLLLHRIKYNADVCGEDVSPGPKTFSAFSEHSAGMRMTEPDVANDDAVFLVITANAGL